MNEKKEIKLGALLSYVLIFFNTIYGLIITPYILKYVGDSAYGVYKSISSLSASLAVMDLGLGTTMTRYMAVYHASDKKEKASNFAGMMFIQFFVLAGVTLVVGIVLIFVAPSFYADSFSAVELKLAKDLLCFLILNLLLRMLENLLFGILGGYGRFGFSNFFKLLNLVARFCLILILLPITKDVRLIVILEAVLVFLTIIVFFIYIRKSLKLRPNLKGWDNQIFKESFGYTALMFIQSITVQFNGNVDNILIGGKLGATFVTIYSTALIIFGMYENLSGSIANIMLPKITKMVVKGSKSEELQSMVETAGRYQFLLMAAALGGFISIGQDFFHLWVGDSFTDCYALVLILIIPVTFSLVQNVSLSIMRAKNKMMYRTVTLMISCSFNIVITLIGISLWGYWGAAYGTAAASLLNLVLLNIYYHRNFKFHIVKMFYHIFKGILPAAILATLVTVLVHRFFFGTWISFFVNMAIFMAIYGCALLLFGLKKEEKNTIFGTFWRKKR